MNLRLIMLFPLVVAGLAARSRAQMVAKVAVEPDNAIVAIPQRMLPSLELLYNGPHSRFARMHLNSLRGSQDQGPKH